ncbi:hypothetical protein L798_09497 [Zootermopsis nevadensis]|uniref:Uncharacterized protein n=1 Tax=Zootermopsis nevadensis TaxID=136037 RepID=A0A067R3H3_ZOONE|nr:hypothetical protein L798_09497 [Zootermopsis nevadensis]
MFMKTKESWRQNLNAALHKKVTVGITVVMRTCVAAKREGCHHVRVLATRCRRTHRESKKKKKTMPLDLTYTAAHTQNCNLGNLSMSCNPTTISDIQNTKKLNTEFTL